MGSTWQLLCTTLSRVLNLMCIVAVRSFEQLQWSMLQYEVGDCS